MKTIILNESNRENVEKILLEKQGKRRKNFRIDTLDELLNIVKNYIKSLEENDLMFTQLPKTYRNGIKLSLNAGGYLSKYNSRLFKTTCLDVYIKNNQFVLDIDSIVTNEYWSGTDISDSYQFSATSMCWLIKKLFKKQKQDIQVETLLKVIKDIQLTDEMKDNLIAKMVFKEIAK